MIQNTTRRFIFQDDKSSKFWEIGLSGSAVTVRYGKMGSTGQVQTKDLGKEEDAIRHLDRLVAEKIGKGYLEQGGNEIASTPEGAETVVVVPLETAKALSAAPKKASKSKVGKKISLKPTEDPESSPESLASCIGQDVATDRLIAKHPNASPEILEKLSHSKDRATRQAVAINPNTPKDALIALAPQFPGDFFKNPAFDWLLLEDPDLMISVGGGVLKNILKRSDCPISFMKWALHKGSEAEQLALAMNTGAPAEILAVLSRRKGVVGDAVKGRKDVSPDVKSATVSLDEVFIAEVQKALSEVKLADVKSAWKRHMVTSAQWPWLSLECRLLVTEVPLALVVAGAMKGHERELAGHTDPEVRALVARFLEDDTSLMEQLAADSSHQVRAELAANPHCVETLYATLAKDKQASVRAAAARSVRVTSAMAYDFAVDPSPLVREAAVASWCLPAESLQLLVSEKLAAIRRPAVSRQEQLSKPAANASTPPEELESIAKTAKGGIRLSLAANPSTPHQCLRQFAKEADVALDKALLENPKLPADIADEIYRRHIKSLGPIQRINLLAHFRTPRAIREVLAERIWIERWPRSKNWLQDAYEFLCAPWTGRAPQDLLSIPKGMESQYAASALRASRLIGLAHPLTPPDLLIKRSNSVDWAERLAIARNTSLPPNMVAKFKKDPHKLVAKQAQLTELAKAEIKDRQEVLLAEEHSPVDWNSILHLINKHIHEKGIRTWEWFGTPWWPHLSLNQRLGHFFRLYRRGGIVREIDLEGVFLSLPCTLERLAQSRYSEIARWISGFKSAPLDLLERMFSSEKNEVAQGNWLSRVSFDLDSELPEKLRLAAFDSVLSDGKWGSFKYEIACHPDTPEDAIVHITSDINNRRDAEKFLTIKELPVSVRAHLNQIISSVELDEIRRWSIDEKSDIRRNAASHLEAPFDVLERLMQDKNKDVKAIAKKTFTQKDILLELNGICQNSTQDSRVLHSKLKLLSEKILETAPDFRVDICRLEECPAALLEIFSKQKDLWSIARLLASHPNTPESVLIKLAKLSRQSDWPRDVCDELCSNPSSSVAVFKTLLESNSNSVRSRAVRSTTIPIDLLLGLETDSSAKVRAALASNGNLPAELVALLGKDSVAAVREAVAARGDLDSNVRLSLALDSDLDVARQALSGSQVDAEFLRLYVQAGGRRFHTSQVSRITDERIINIIISEGSNFDWGGTKVLKESIGSNPKTPLETLILLLGDLEKSVVASVIGNPALPEDLLRNALKDETSTECWRAVQSNRFAPVDLIELSVQKVGSDRYNAKSWYAMKLAGESVKAQVETFLDDATELARDPGTSLDRLKSLAGCGVWAIRCAVASNTSYPTDAARALQEALWIEVSDALFGPEPQPISAASLNEEDFRIALDRLDLMPPADDKKAIAASAKSSEVLRRVAAVLSPGIQPSVLKMLLEDPTECVKALAAEKLRAMEI